MMMQIHVLIVAVLSALCGEEALALMDGSYSEGDHSTNETSIEYVPLSLEHPCKRKCVLNDEPMTCKFDFAVEWYQTLSKACYDCPRVLMDCYRPDCIIANGIERAVMVINRMLPGPSIEVCLGDKIEVNVENFLMGESTTIHWHGHHQRGTPYMDGVPYVTQCPIPPGNNFIYNFTALNAGTHFWHSHTGMQRGDGAFGPFIVHVPDEINPHADLYDYDLTNHTVSLLDWDIDLSLRTFVAHYHSSGDNKPSNLLINGLGIRDFKNKTLNTPIARFFVDKGYRYRFRIINAGFLNCPVEMSIDNHSMLVISSDGNDFEPVEVESLVSYAGERFDVVINANQTKGIYWIRFRGLMDCDERFTSAHQIAILQYEGTSNEAFPFVPVPNYLNSHKEGLQLNALNKGTEHNESIITMPELKSLDPWDTSMQEEADEKYFVSYDFHKIDNPHYHKYPHYGFNNNTKSQTTTPQLNHISFKLQKFPLLSGRDHITDDMFCNEDTLKDRNCTAEYCHCTHVVKVKLNTIVEVILVDNGFTFDANHPFHLHGHSFRVVGMEKLGKNVTVDQVKKLDAAGKLKRNLEDAVIKDTVTVPDGGYTIIRFNASNPGYWIFHCHIEFHVEVGMAMIFKFGEHYEMPPIPRGFPQCGTYTDNANSATIYAKGNSLILILLLTVTVTLLS